MGLWAAVHSFAVRLFGLSQVERELEEEFRSHVQHRADDLERTGLSRTEAARQARLEFGSYERHKEESHEAYGDNLLHVFLQDLRFGLRLLRTSPGFTLIAILLLGLGIGATTAVFSLVNTILLRPLPYRETEKLVIPWNRPATGIAIGGFDKTPWGPREFHEMETETKTYRYLGAFQNASFNLTGVGEPVLVEGLRVSSGFFPALGVSPMLGRVFTKEEDQPGHEHEVMLGNALWRERFHSEGTIVGRTIDLNGAPYIVVGVMPPGFAFPHANEMPDNFPFPHEAQFWMPAAMPAITPRFAPSELAIVARLQPGVSVAQAQAAMDVFAARMDKLVPDGKGSFGSRVTPLESQVAGDTRRPLLLIFSAVGVVLLIVCSNMASLLLTRSISRRREFAVRAALGAGRGRILRQLLTESLLLSCAGSVVGLAIAFGGVWLVRNFGPSNIPRLDEVAPDLRTLSFMLLSTLLTGVFIGFAPALGALRIPLIDSLKAGHRTVAGGAYSRFRNALVVGQIALALMMVVASGLLLQTFYRLLNVNAGFRGDHTLTFELSLPTEQYRDRRQMIQFYQQAAPRLREAAGVQSAAITTAVPMGGAPDATSIRIPGRVPVLPSQAPVANYTVISPGFFKTVGIELESGRDFFDSDDENAPAVTIVNRAMARDFWPGEEAMGKQVIVPAQKRPLTIIGIVDNFKHSSLREDASPEMFVPYTQDTWPSLSVVQVVVRSHADSESVIGGIGSAIHSLDSALPLAKVTTLSNLVDDSVSRQRFSAVLMAFFGAFSLLLAVVGIYGVVSYSADQRTRELGIRMALGAARSRVFGSILGHGLRLSGLGIACGLIGAIAISRLLRSYLYGVGAYDPLTLILVPLILALVALLAAFFPARRAASADPMAALRAE